VLDLGEGRYALYAHLQPGLRVRSGERVVRGQFLGRIGNTGRTDAPHLHFHVADAPTLDAEGIPFVFDVFERDGRRHTDEMPLNGWRISFPQP
jgi:murein DD-endopeptidase MepM/ murein hydrolase activator NlpD